MRFHSVERSFDYYTPARSPRDRIVSFDFTNLAGSSGMPTAIVLRGNQSIEIHELHAPSTLSFSSDGTLAVSKQLSQQPQRSSEPESEHFLEDNIRFASLGEIGSTLQDQDHIRKAIVSGQLRRIGSNENEDQAGSPVSSRQRHEDVCVLANESAKVPVEIALAISATSRLRCKEGYSLDCGRNKALFEGNEWLRRMWTWIQSVLVLRPSNPC